DHAAEVELRAGRAGVAGAVADPDVGDAPVAHGRVPEVAPPPHQVILGVGLGRVLRQADAPLAGAAEVDDEELEPPGVRGPAGAFPGPPGRVGEGDGDVEADGRVRLGAGGDAGQDAETLHER